MFKHAFKYLSVQLFVEGEYRTELKPTLDFMTLSELFYTLSSVENASGLPPTWES